MPNARPILLNRREVRELLRYGRADIRRPARSGAIALQRHWTVGDRLWVREGFAARRDGESIRVCAAVERGPGEETVRVVPIAQGLERFASEGYRSWEAKYMPRPFSRLSVELAAVRTEAGDDGRELVLVLKVVIGGSGGRT